MGGFGIDRHITALNDHTDLHFISISHNYGKLFNPNMTYNVRLSFCKVRKHSQTVICQALLNDWP